MPAKPKRQAHPFGFSKAAQKYLHKAGWTPERMAIPSIYLNAYAEESLPLVPSAKEFLQRFGGLIIRYVTSTDQHDVLEFRADDAVRLMGRGGLLQFESILQVRPLCPIGHYLHGLYLLVMDETGRVFGVSDDSVTHIGDSGDEAIDNILAGKEPHLIKSDVIAPD